MRDWLILLSGLILWSAHFFLLYAIGEFAGDGMGERIAVLIATLVGLTVCGFAAASIIRMDRCDGFDRWRMRLALAGLLLGAIAILWQGLPALLVA